MGSFQDILDRSIDDLPRMALRQLVTEKLHDRGINDAARVDRIVVAILDRTDISEDDVPDDFAINAADEDRISQIAGRFGETMPDLVETLSRDMAALVADEYKRQRPTIVSSLTTERIDRRRAIADQWGEAFDALRLLLDFCVERGDQSNQVQMNTRLRLNAVRNETLSRLHIRACRVADEILTLLENGFAEGARARWRTMLEVTVVAQLIVEGGDALAQRYVDHDAVDRLKALKDHQRAAEITGTRVVTAIERKAIEREHLRMVRRYGDHFRGMYGWASGQLGLSHKPTFVELQDAAGKIALKPQYREACFGTHASPQALQQPLHNWDPLLHVPDMFAAGFDAPGIDTAYSLVHATATLFDDPWDLDKLIDFRVMALLRDEVEQSFRHIAHAIDRRERRSMDKAMRRLGKPATFARRSA